ncbi:hypothetical protein HNQ49_003971 [Parapusillimonas granuli]|nr:hypothetical protein [Parapusillimonas granuli]
MPVAGGAHICVPGRDIQPAVSLRAYHMLLIVVYLHTRSWPCLS